MSEATKPKPLELTVDPKRALAEDERATGIFVRARDPNGRIRNADIVELDRASLLVWLRSRGGDNPWAEDVVGILLGHGHLHPVERSGER
jgi:hypothetical protein